jgi:zinc protease
VKDDAVQSVLRIGLPNVPFDHPDMPALSLATSALGGFTLARLFSILREQKGYTYGAYAFPDMRRYGRATVIGTSVGNEYTVDTMRTIYDELRRISTEPLDAEELENARQYMLGSFARNNETPQQTAGLAWTILQYGLADDYYTTYISRLQAVTVEECLHAQQRYLDPALWCIGVAGQEQVLRTALDGMVQRTVVMDIDTRMLKDA